MGGVLPSKEKEVAAQSLEEYIVKHGKPESVRTDKDPTFAGAACGWVKTAQKHGAKTFYSSPPHAAAKWES